MVYFLGVYRGMDCPGCQELRRTQPAVQGRKLMNFSQVRRCVNRLITALRRELLNLVIVKYLVKELTRLLIGCTRAKNQSESRY